ncbi:PLD nuclease N-terminal domain-containing protein [Bowdeniella massiliensis]|uniref:PLD nuclease N-terminal domain-containing protein n=1 Tax=Bowdeniella massiliensis TaxID=2932264 RepID=UPI0020295483|nr:PLDc N-terminal domain-containing protein [Bowdeniella massiliensis]
MARVLPVIVIAALMIYALADCVMTPRDRVPRGLPKGLWIILILVPVVGPLAWLFMSRMAGSAPYQRGRQGSWNPTSPSNNPRGGIFGRKAKPVAPDDDETFLADLDWQARKAHYERQRRQREAEEEARKKKQREERRRQAEAGEDDESDTSAS